MRADLRITSEDSVFGIPAVHLGLGYDFDSTRALVDLVGASHAREILLTGDRFDAHAPMRMGLVNRVVPAGELEPAVREVAATIAENAPLTVRLVNASIGEAVKESDDRDHELVERVVADCFASEDYAEGRRAFAEKPQPKFTGR